MSERSQVIRDALKKDAERGRAAKEKRRARKVREKPWQVLGEEWQKALRAQFGMDHKPAPWTGKDRQLARKLITEFGLDKAVEMVGRFVESWNKPGVPGFGYFYVARASFTEARVNGARVDINHDEFDQERDGTGPKVGW